MLSQIIISNLHASDSWRASVLWIILHVNWTLLKIAECCHQQHQRLDLNTFSLRRLWEGSTAVWMMCWSYNLLSAQPHYSYEDCSCSLPNLQHHHHSYFQRFLDHEILPFTQRQWTWNQINMWQNQTFWFNWQKCCIDCWLTDSSRVKSNWTTDRQADSWSDSLIVPWQRRKQMWN